MDTRAYARTEVKRLKPLLHPTLRIQIPALWNLVGFVSCVLRGRELVSVIQIHAWCVNELLGACVGCCMVPDQEMGFEQSRLVLA